MPRPKYYKTKIGFTLVETLVALSIVMLGLMAAFSVAQLGVSSTSLAKDRITVFFLVQEAIEAVKSRRDHNLLLTNASIPTNWLDGMAACANAGGCDYDLKTTLSDPNTNETFLDCASANNCTLQNVTDPATQTQYYGYSGGAPNSRFTRQIFITQFASGVEASVRVKVTWDNDAHEFQTFSYIFNWF